MAQAPGQVSRQVAYLERLRADPVRYAAYLERARARYKPVAVDRRTKRGNGGRGPHGDSAEGYPKHLRCYVPADVQNRGQAWCAFEALARELAVACLSGFTRSVDTEIGA